jgi:hypothetical protein
MADNNPYLTVGAPSYASPLVNLFGPQQGQGQPQPGQPQQGGQPPQQQGASQQYGQQLGAVLSKLFGLGPMQGQAPAGRPQMTVANPPDVDAAMPWTRAANNFQLSANRQGALDAYRNLNDPTLRRSDANDALAISDAVRGGVAPGPKGFGY